MNIRAIAITAAIVLMVIMPRPAAAGTASEGPTADIETVRRQAEEKYDRLEKTIRDITIVQEARVVTSAGESTARMTLMKKGGKSRIVTQARMPKSDQDVTRVLLSTGRKAWLYSPQTGLREVSLEEVNRMQIGGFWWKDMLEGAKVVGSFNINGRDSHVIDLKPGRSELHRLWVDKKSLVPLIAEGTTKDNWGLQVVFSEFREIAPGFEIPYQTRTRFYRGGHSTIKILSIAMNKGLDDSLFDPDRLKDTLDKTE